jgi:hypothetical protein
MADAIQMSALISMIEQGFIPDGGGSTAGIILEAFPDFWEALERKLREFSAYIAESGISAEAAGLVSAQAVHCDAAREAASSAALANLARFLKN